MCKSALHRFLTRLPKCEHHIHLEGSLSPSLVFSLASRNRISLPADDPSFASAAALLARYRRFTSLDDFLRYYMTCMSVLLRAADFESLAWEYFRRAHAEGVVHAEVFFDPQAHTGRGVRYETVVEGFTRGCRRAEAELGMSTELIMCFLRHLPVGDAEKTLEMARGDLKSGVLAGVGLDSSEREFLPRLFKGVYKGAKEMGARRTAHAGEEAGAEYVWEALRDLEVERIDHGIHAADDELLMEELARRRILVTMCPLSNVQLKCVKSVGELPVRKFLEKDVRFSINSDDPAYFGSYILENYCAVQEAFDLSLEEWERVARVSIEGSWCDDKRKKVLLDKVMDVVNEFRSTS